MSNGVAALASLPPPQNAAVSEHGRRSQDGIERQVGEAVANAAVLICQVWFVDRELTPESRETVGNLFVRLFELQTANPGIDFAQAGKKVLRERYGDSLLLAAKRDDATLDRAFDEILDWPLSILRKVTLVERLRAN